MTAALAFAEGTTKAEPDHTKVVRADTAEVHLRAVRHQVRGHAPAQAGAPRR